MFGVFSSHSRIFHSYGDVTITGEGQQILTYSRHSWSLNIEGSLTCNTYCDTEQPFIMQVYIRIPVTLPPRRSTNSYKLNIWGKVLPQIFNFFFRFKVSAEQRQKLNQEKEIEKQRDLQRYLAYQQWVKHCNRI